MRRWRRSRLGGRCAFSQSMLRRVHNFRIFRMSPKKLPLRPNVCMLVYNNKGKLFLGERDGEPEHWQFPQGGAEPRYTLRQNVIRELREELGLKKRSIGKLTKLQSTHEYEWRTPPRYAHKKWRGQKQTFWLVEFIGSDSDIDLTAYKEPEFASWRWCSVAEVKRRAAPFRIAGYRAPLREFLEFKRTKLKTKGASKKKATSRMRGRA
jgi:putative (di)nucleoside polyphosphate hydrolase